MFGERKRNNQRFRKVGRMLSSRQWNQFRKHRFDRQRQRRYWLPVLRKLWKKKTQILTENLKCKILVWRIRYRIILNRNIQSIQSRMNLQGRDMQSIQSRMVFQGRDMQSIQSRINLQGRDMQNIRNRMVFQSKICRNRRRMHGMVLHQRCMKFRQNPLMWNL